MRRAGACIALAALLIAGCHSSEPEEAGAADPETAPEAAPEPVAPAISEATEQAPPASEPIAAQTPTDDAPLPAWWHDEPRRAGDVLYICLKAIGATPDEAGEALATQFYEHLASEFGEDPVDVGMTQDVTLLADGRYRLAVLFEISRSAEGPDG